MTEWFTKRPGHLPSRDEGDAVVSLIGGGVGDWVRLPPELGGHRAKILEVTQDWCACGDHIGTLYELDETRRSSDPLAEDRQIYVSECRRAGFLWHVR